MESYKNKKAGVGILVVETGDLYETRTRCAEALGVGVSSVSQCLNGKTHTCAGYHLAVIEKNFVYELDDKVLATLEELYGERLTWRMHPWRRNIYVSTIGYIARNERGQVRKCEPHEINSGYLMVALHDATSEFSDTALVHRLVAETYIPNPHNKPDVNHKNTNKHINEVWNLQWCTKAENTEHARCLGLLDKERVFVWETGEIFDSMTECAKALGCTLSGIHDCKSGRQKQHHGYHFKFLGGVDVVGEIINKFPGYYFEIQEDNKPHNMFRGEDIGFGGYVYSEPGYYENVALLDVQSMHPNSIIALNYFGEYTKNYKELLDARVAIKHGDFESARKMMGGKLAPFLTDEKSAKDLSNALKTCLNSAYGLTAAKFDNPLRDNRNKNNLIALRGSLFMVSLKYEVQVRGFTVAHIKTDSIKIPNATPEIIEFCMDFAKKYGYTFEHEATYSKMCLVNKSTYIAKYSDDETINGKKAGQWAATGDQFQVPYVFKTLFSKEPILFEDMCETYEVKTALYLDMNEDLPEGEHNYIFIGRVGLFCPIKPGCGGGLLMREAVDKKTGEKKYDSANGAKDYRWKEAEVVKGLGKEDTIDRSFYNHLVDEAVATISDYVDFEQFVADDDIEETTAFDVR